MTRKMRKELLYVDKYAGSHKHGGRRGPSSYNNTKDADGSKKGVSSGYGSHEV